MGCQGMNNGIGSQLRDVERNIELAKEWHGRVAANISRTTGCSMAEAMRIAGSPNRETARVVTNASLAPDACALVSGCAAHVGNDADRAKLLASASEAVCRLAGDKQGATAAWLFGAAVTGCIRSVVDAGSAF